MAEQTEGAPSLAALLDSHREEIAAAWAELVHRLPDSHYRRRPLDEIRASTRRGLDATIAALATGSYADLEAYLTDVSLTRLEMGFDITEVIEALLLGKDAALPVIWRGYPPGSSAAREAIAQMDACLRWIASRFSALYATEAHRQLREEQQRTALMLEIAQAASGSLDLEEVLRRVARGIAAAVGVRHCGIYLVDEKNGLLTPTEGRANPEAMGPDFTRSFRARPLDPARDAFTGEVVESKRAVVCTNAETDPRTDKEVVRLLGLKSILAVPFVVKDRMLAIAMVSTFDEYYTFTEEQIDLAQGIADAAAMAIQNARLYEQAQELAAVKERQRLARDLHDAVTQTLFSASLIAEVLPRLWERNPDEGRRRLEELRQLTRGALAEMRTLLLELRPAALAETNLGDLLRQLAEATTGRARVPVTVTVEGQGDVPTQVRVALYRIAQEALNNVAKHAGAGQATVSLRYIPPDVGGERGGAGAVELSIRDDGRGFDPQDVSPERLGLGIMRERAGAVGATLTVESKVGRGTEVVIVWQDQPQDE